MRTGRSGLPTTAKFTTSLIAARTAGKGHQFSFKYRHRSRFSALRRSRPGLCVKTSNGIFAFAICDLRSEHTIFFLARDHFGVKPFYYWQRGSQTGLCFGDQGAPGSTRDRAPSSIPERSSIFDFLWVPDPATMFKRDRETSRRTLCFFRNGRTDFMPILGPDISRRECTFSAIRGMIGGRDTRSVSTSRSDRRWLATCRLGHF